MARTATAAKAGPKITARACVAGGGPAGMMLGFLLARAGLDVVVLEKHADFLRDFRGDTVHPSTMQVMHELGLLDEFLKLPHQALDRLSGQLGEVVIHAADFRNLKTAAPFIALMPQWDFLNFLADKAKAFPEFRLMMRAEAVDLIRDGERVTGVKVKTPDGEIEIAAEVIIGADGRHSTIRECAGLKVIDVGAPMDVLWLRLPRHEGDEEMPLGRIVSGRIFVMIPRGDYFQCGYVVEKGGADKVKAAGLPALRTSIEHIAPMMKDRTGALKGWDDVHLLTVAIDRLERWSAPGVLCIGDAAHAMSPIGGVGINLAVQDAVATANILSGPLRAGRLTQGDLAAVQRRRAWPTRMIQAIQVFIQNHVVAPTLKGATLRPPWPAKLLDRYAWLQSIPARVIGVGVRYERVRTPNVH